MENSENRHPASLEETVLRFQEHKKGVIAPEELELLKELFGIGRNSEEK